MEVSIDFTAFNASLNDLSQKQLPFAAATTVNQLMVEVQDAERLRIEGTFTLRRPEWIERSVKIAKFATKADPNGILGIHPPGGDSRADILSKFEDGGVKTSQGGNGFVAIPSFIRHNKAGLVPNNLRPKNLHLSGARGGMLGKGDQRTFIVQLKNGDRAIFQRIGSKRRDRRRGYGHGRDPNLVLLYYLKPSVPIPAELGLHETAQTVTQQKFEQVFGYAWRMAVAGAR